MKKQSVLPLLLLAASLILGVVSYLVLPDTVVTQLSAGGSGATTMAKLPAVLLPVALGAGGAVAALTGKDSGRKKSMIVSAVGLLVFVLMLAVNL